MSHKEYIEQCDKDQLDCLVEMAKERLQQIKDSEKVSLWVVSDTILNYRYFKEEHFQQALDYLVEIIPKETMHNMNVLWGINKIVTKAEELKYYSVWEPEE